MDLTQKRCVACEGGVQPMTPMEAEAMSKHISGWTVAREAKNISKTFTFKNYVEAMEFANKITPVAEAEGHHPDLSLGWGKVQVVLTTHAIHGLSENDFILAAKIDKVA